MSARQCPDCQASVGERHEEGCDVALCVLCGQQQLQCSAVYDHDLATEEAALVPMQTWTGEWPGDAECREYGYWARWTIVTKYSPDGTPDSGLLVPCAPDHPHARTNLNYLPVAAVRGEIEWSRERERFVRPAA